ncbi:hypothetical protein EKM02_04460 [Flavobacterium sp. RSP49]|nr:hypothetical protein EKM00_02045 [Flavobacterium sp. RSP15]RTZ01911.1 hypothetical protein EKM02_04460 [Flavobacterium sp. RSP49]
MIYVRNVTFDKRGSIFIIGTSTKV